MLSSKLRLASEWPRQFLSEHSLKDAYPEVLQNFLGRDLEDLPVIVLPGFSTLNERMDKVVQLINDLGGQAYQPKIGRNWGPTDYTWSYLKSYVDQIYKQNGEEPIAIVGWSLGGIFARELARHAPDKVGHIITKGSPYDTANTPGSNKILGKAVDLTTYINDKFHKQEPGQWLNNLGYVLEGLKGGLGKDGRLFDAFFTAAYSGIYFMDSVATLPKALKDKSFANMVAQPLEGVSATHIHTMSDGIVCPHSCIGGDIDGVEHIDVKASHMGLPVDRQVLTVIADRLLQHVENADKEPSFDKAKCTVTFLANDGKHGDLPVLDGAA